MAEEDDLLELLEDLERDSRIETCSTECDIWSPDTIKLLLDTRLGMETDFQKGEKGRNTLWNVVVMKMKKVKPGLQISANDARKKFNNLSLTYRRNKKKKSKSGSAPINWSYYDRFDEVYGSCHNINPPGDIIIDSLREEVPSEDSQSTDHQPENVINHSVRKKRKMTSHEVLVSYWKEEDEKEQRRHDERMLIEKEKNEIDKSKVQVMNEIKELLSKLIE